MPGRLLSIALLLLAPAAFGEEAAPRSVRGLMLEDAAALGAPLTDAQIESASAAAPKAEVQVLDEPPYVFKRDGATTFCKSFAAAPVHWKYCVTTTQGNSNKSILYFLHGRGHNAENWARSGDYKALIRRDWKARGEDAPIVVSVSFGGFWLLIDKNSSKRSGLLDVFVKDVMPAVERDLDVKNPRRFLMGESMGGFNAAQLVMKHPELFERGVLACPALPDISPFSTAEEKAAYMRAPGVNRIKVWLMLYLGKKTFRTENDWERSDPFVLGKELLGPRTPPLMISAGDRDQYGLYKGIGDFAELAEDQGVDVTYTPLHGGHCSADPAAIADFLRPD